MKFKVLLGFSFLGWLVSVVVYVLSYFDKPGLMDYSFLIHGGVMLSCGYLILLMCMTKRPLQNGDIGGFLRYIRGLRPPFGILFSSGFLVLLANMIGIGIYDRLGESAPTGTQGAEIEAARFFSSAWMFAYWLGCIGWFDRMEKRKTNTIA